MEEELTYFICMYNNAVEELASTDKIHRATEKFLIHMIETRKSIEDAKAMTLDGRYYATVIPWIDELHSRAMYYQSRKEEITAVKNGLQDSINQIRKRIEDAEENEKKTKKPMV